MPMSELRQQAEPGWRSAANVQGTAAGRADVNVQRVGVGNPEQMAGEGRMAMPAQANMLPI